METMFALIFLSVGLLAIAQLMPLAGAQLTSSRNHTHSQEVAQTVLDELTSLEYNATELTAGSHTLTTEERDVTYTIQDNVPVPGTKRVDMIISWEESQGLQAINYTTLIAE